MSLAKFAIFTGIVFFVAAVLGGIFMSVLVNQIDTKQYQGSFDDKADISGDISIITLENVDATVRFTRQESNLTTITYSGDYTALGDQVPPKLVVTTSQDSARIRLDYPNTQGFDWILDTDAEIVVALGKNTKLEDLRIDTVSGEVFIQDEDIDYLEVTSVSGDLTLSGMKSREVVLNSVSGNADFSGLLLDARLDTISGTIDLDLAGPFEEVSFDAVSGNLDVQAPSFELCNVRFDSVSGDLTNTFPDGSCQASFRGDTVSGDVTLRTS